MIWTSTYADAIVVTYQEAVSMADRFGFVDCELISTGGGFIVKNAEGLYLGIWS